MFQFAQMAIISFYVQSPVGNVNGVYELSPYIIINFVCVCLSMMYIVSSVTLVQIITNVVKLQLTDHEVPVFCYSWAIIMALHVLLQQ